MPRDVTSVQFILCYIPLRLLRVYSMLLNAILAHACLSIRDRTMISLHCMQVVGSNPHTPLF